MPLQTRLAAAVAAIATFSAAGAGVPEPATWGVMMMGLGSLGMVLRRQRSLQPALARI